MKVDSFFLKLKMLIHEEQLSKGNQYITQDMGKMNGQDKLEVGLYKTLILVNLV